MNLENVQKTWECFGATDPMWAVLGWEGKDRNRWNAEEFFQTGVNDINRVMSQIDLITNYPLNTSRCLDFGCGLGRLTIPLAGHFTNVYGVDISPSMISKANAFSSDVPNARYHINLEPDLKLFESDFFDCIITLIVLQHLEISYQKNYTAEFVRLIKPGGLAVFQMPDQLERFASYREFKSNTRPEMEMHGMSTENVTSHIESCGGKVLQILEDDACGNLCRSFRYFVTKQG